MVIFVVFVVECKGVWSRMLYKDEKKVKKWKIKFEEFFERDL